MLEAASWNDGIEMKQSIPHSTDPLPVLVAVHGISRNVDEVFERFVEAANDRMIVLAPYFEKSRFKDYQRLGLVGNGERTDLILDAALDGFGLATGRDLHRFHLFGFSGGAQFAHRYAMLHANRIRSLHVASSGWYTFPDPDTAWPYGIGVRRPARPMIRNLPFFRAMPKTVYVGDRDTARDPALRQGGEIDHQQGKNRVERARNWSKVAGNADLVAIAGASHSFKECCNAKVGPGLAVEVVERCLACR